MKRLLIVTFVLIAGVLFVAGCHGQIPPNPTAYTCPASSGTIYTPLNQSTPAAGLTFTDSKPAAGVYCYIAQSTLGTQVSNPSNTAGPLTLSGTNSTSLTWSAPGSGPVPSGYVISRAPAIASTILAPALGTGTVAKNQTAPQELVAKVEPAEE